METSARALRRSGRRTALCRSGPDDREFSPPIPADPHRWRPLGRPGRPEMQIDPRF
ncbi:hypothetical protein [Lysobacter gummosus]|uniref:hypothetical protein n=1 Tax=Lysobacter gummosus TaxID=262324 RepID=UPI0036302174